MTPQEFIKRFPHACVPGQEEILKYPNMAAWWAATERPDWMIWACREMGVRETDLYAWAEVARLIACDLLDAAQIEHRLRAVEPIVDADTACAACAARAAAYAAYAAARTSRTSRAARAARTSRATYNAVYDAACAAYDAACAVYDAECAAYDAECAAYAAACAAACAARAAVMKKSSGYIRALIKCPFGAIEKLETE